MRWSGTIRPGTVYNDMCSHYAGTAVAESD
jgi:hypothetical protein